MTASNLLFGFHAVAVRLKTAPGSVIEVHVDASRRDEPHAHLRRQGARRRRPSSSTATTRA